MMNIIASRHLPPLLAGCVGLCIGIVGPSLFRPDPTAQPDSAPSARHRAADHSAKATASRRPQGPTSRLIQNLETASAADCQQLVHAIHQAQQGGKEIELEAIFNRWLKFEPIDAILTHLETLEDPWQTSWNTALFRAWVSLDENAAMNRKSHHNTFITARALFAIQSANPSFSDYFEGTQNSFTFNERAVAALTLLARDRPEVAMLVGTAEIHQDLKAAAITAVAKGWASRDPTAALSWLQSINANSDAINAVFLEWAKLDPAEATAAMRAAGLKDVQRDGSTSSHVLSSLLNPQDQSKIANLASLAILRDPFIDVSGFHRLWMESGTGDSHGLFSFGSDIWRPADLPNAILEASSLPSGSARDAILEELFRAWAYPDLQAAAAFANQHGLESRTISNLLESALPPDLREAAINSPRETFAPLLEEPSLEGQTRNHLLSLASEWTRTDPESAANWLFQQLSAAPQNPSAYNAIANRLTLQVGTHWSIVDPLAAIQWVESLPDEGFRSDMWSGMENQVKNYSPDLAFQYSAAWLDGRNRMEILQSNLNEVVSKIGKPVAFDLLHSANLASEERAALTATLNSAAGGSSR